MAQSSPNQVPARAWRKRAPRGGWPKDEATAYAIAVRDGKSIAGPHVRNACARHLEDLVNGKKRGLRWEPELVAWVLGFFRDVLRLNGGEFEDVPFNPEPWQAFVLGSLFGWLAKDRRGRWVRRFRVAFIETAKGSGKSPLAAGTGLYMLVADGEARAEVYSAATKKDQAMIMFRDAVAMVDQSPDLSGRIRKSGRDPVWNLADLRTGSFFRPIASDDAQSGPRPHCALLDEVHEHKNATVIEMMRAGIKQRRQPLILMITNSGFDRRSVCFDRHEYGVKVASGTADDDEYFAFICAIDVGEDPLEDEPDEELGYPISWAKTNPSLEVTPGLDYLRGQVREAKGMPGKESLVRRLNFCEWVEASNPWIDGDLWRASERQPEEFPSQEELEERPCFLALDLSDKRDLTSLAAVWPDDEGGYDARTWSWTPEDTLLERARRDNVPYDRWVDDGHLIAVPGRIIGYDFVAQFLADELVGTFALRGLAFDPWHIDRFIEALSVRIGLDCWIGEIKRDEESAWWVEKDRGYAGDGLMMVRHGQGTGGGGAQERTLWMPESVNGIERVVMQGVLRVLWNPALTFASASAVLHADAAGNRKWEKQKSTGRIDPLVALCMALGLALADAELAPADDDDALITVMG